MMEFLSDYGLFLAKTVTVLVALGIAIAMIAGASRRGSAVPGIRVDKLNDRFQELGRAVRRAALNKAAFKKHEKADKQARKRAERPRAKTSIASATSAPTGLRA